MPNLTSPSDIHKGYYNESLKLIHYENISGFKDLEAPKNTTSHIGHGNNKTSIFFLLLDINGELLSSLKVDRKIICGQTYFQINKISSIVRKKGYATYLYNLAIRHCKFPLISDSVLTRPGSYNIWRSLITTRTVSPYEIQYLNTDDCTIQNYDSRKSEIFYWGFDEDMLEVYKDDPENLDYQLNDNNIDEDTYDFFKDNMYKIKNRTNVRFIMKYNGS